MSFNCEICFNSFSKSEIIKLRCGHIFNWKCLESYLITFLYDMKKCPTNNCGRLLMDSEIKQILSTDDIEEYERACLGKIPSIDDIRERLEKLSDSFLIPNPRIFQCEVCKTEVGKDQGIMLRNCFDNICRFCLREYVHKSVSLPIKCPFKRCRSILSDRDCREILSDNEKLWYERLSLNNANIYYNLHIEYCQGRGCTYMCTINKDTWECPLCKYHNHSKQHNASFMCIS